MVMDQVGVAIAPDTPIDKPDFDLFGYSAVAKRVAGAIMKMPCSDGIVISIDGKWGAGKTSFLRLIKHHLETYNWAPIPEPCVIWYCPWWMAGQNQLGKQLLREFVLATSNYKIGKKSFGLIGEHIAKYIDSIEICFASLNISVRSADFKNSKPLIDEKISLSNEMRKSFHRFVFMIDDIDRLQPDELCEFFKVIKGVGDLPNVIYVLAFDHNIVNQSLSTKLGIDGSAYIEKIIQVKFDLPHIDSRVCSHEY